MARLPVGALLGSVAALAVGVAAGALAERRLVHDRLAPDASLPRKLGVLRGEPHHVPSNDGTQLYAEVDTPLGFRPGEDPTVIFSHGYSLNLNTWHFQRAALRPHARLVFWDQRAHGRSERGPQSSHQIDQLGHDLRAIIGELAPEGPLVLVGHSMGGMTVMSLAASYPELVRERAIGVGLLGTSAGGLGETLLGLPRPVARTAHRMVPVVAPALIDGADVIEKSRQRTNDLTKVVLHRYSFASRVPPEVAEFAAQMINATPVDVVAEFLPTFDKHDKRAALAVISGIETLVMVGARDRLTPLDHSFEIVRRVPHAELVVMADTGHMLMLERPEEVDRELLGLLERAKRAWPAAQ